MNAFHLLPGCRVERIHRADPSGFRLEAHGARDGAHCPACGVWSEAEHGSYQRRPADPPDRWHLLQNTREMLTRWLFGVYGRLRRLPAVPAACPPRRGVRLRAFPRDRTAHAVSAASRARSLARYQEVRRRRVAGESLRAIKKATGLARATVRRFARAESFPERAVRAPGPSQLDPFIPWLEKRLTAGCENASALYRELRGRGYAGGSRQVHKWVQTQRRAPAKTTPPCRRGLPPVPGQVDASPLPSPRQLAWLLLQPSAKLDATQKATVAQIEQDKEVRKAGALARRFTALVQASGVAHRRAPASRRAALRRWLVRASTCGVPALQTFAAGVQQDFASIQTALTTGWSNGQTEGHVNKLKLLKRQMYGRARFDLLRRRFLLAS